MADLLPSRPDLSNASRGEPRVIGVDSDEADALLGALSSRTARRILTTLHESPSPPAELADRVDTSLQNVQYHLDNLADAGLVEVADTAYSEKGREMKVYAPADRALVVVAGREEDTAGLAGTLKRLLGGVGVLGLASLVVERLLDPTTGPLLPGFGSSGSGQGGGPGGAGGGSGANADGGSGGGGAPSGGESTVDAGASATPTPAADTTAAGEGTRATPVADTTTEAAGATPAPEATGTAAEATGNGTGTADAVATTAGQASEVVGQGAVAGAGDALAASPGLLFFLGGVTALLLLALLVWRR